MSRRAPRRSLTTKLQDLQNDLAALTLRVAALQRHPDSASPSSFVLGARVRFFIPGQGPAFGVIIGITAQRVRIRADITSHIFLRAPHNVTALRDHV